VALFGGYQVKIVFLLLHSEINLCFLCEVFSAVNGELLPFFTPSRVLRQGDPISPYLFLLCGEGLSALSNHYGGASVDRGIRVSLQALWINH
jgi:hypothetical protein